MEPSEVGVLVTAAAQGDPVAWRRLYEGLGGLVWSVVRGCGLYGAAGEDVFQTVWLRFAEHVGRLREPDRAAGWLATTARNEAIRVSRLDARSVALAELDERPDAGEGPDLQLLGDERQRAVRGALELLDERCRNLLRLTFGDPPLPYDQLAEVMGMPRGSLGPTRARCLEKLKAVLTGSGYPGEGGGL